MNATPDNDRAPLPRIAAAALWMLPVHGVLLALGTLTHEPDHAADFTAWSEYVTTDRFVISHVVASVLGAGLGAVGVAAALCYLVRGRAAGTAVVGAALTLVGSTMFVAMFGTAAFAQPAMGRAFLDGDGAMRAFYDEVYGAPLLVNFAIGAVCWLVGAGLLGLAVARTGPELRWAGYLYGTGLVLFPLTGFTISFLQPVMGAVSAAAAVVVALRLPAAVTPRQEPVDQRSRTPDAPTRPQG